MERVSHSNRRSNSNYGLIHPRVMVVREDSVLLPSPQATTPNAEKKDRVMEPGPCGPSTATRDPKGRRCSNTTKVCDCE